MTDLEKAIEAIEKQQGKLKKLCPHRPGCKEMDKKVRATL